MMIELPENLTLQGFALGVCATVYVGKEIYQAYSKVRWRKNGVERRGEDRPDTPIGMHPKALSHLAEIAKHTACLPKMAEQVSAIERDADWLKEAHDHDDPDQPGVKIWWITRQLKSMIAEILSIVKRLERRLIPPLNGG